MSSERPVVSQGEIVEQPLRVRAGHRGASLALLALTALAVTSSAMEYEPTDQPTCDLQLPDTTSSPPVASSIDSVGTFDALVIFAKYPDGDNWSLGDPDSLVPLCESCGDNWVSTDSLPPSWAGSLIDASTSSLTPGSVTHFFDTWSQGKHALIGTVLDTVLVCDFSVLEVETLGTSVADLSILAKADTALGGLAAADLTNDGAIDYVFIHYQAGRAVDPSDSTVHNLGISAKSIGASIVSMDGTTTSDGTVIYPYIRPVASVHTLVQHRWYALASMAHEYGHRLMRAANFAQGGNFEHLHTMSRYSIMQGTFPTGLQMSGVLRHKLNWIDPPIIAAGDSLPYETTLTLSASYLAHEGSMAIIEPDDSLLGDTPQYFILEARRDSLAGHVYSYGQPDTACCFRTLDNDRGLLITHVVGDPSYSGTWPGHPAHKPPVAEVELATGSFDTTDASPDPIAGLNNIRSKENHLSLGGFTAREWDLFEPQEHGDRARSNAFTPYTNPNTNLYDDGRTLSTNTWHQTTYSGISIYNIEWTSAAQESIRMDIRFDSLAAPPADTVAADTEWQGLIQLTGDLVVKEGVTLTVDDDAMIVASARKDRHAAGQDTTVELLSRGQVVFGGADSTISVTSTRDDAFEHWQIIVGPTLDDERYNGEVDPAVEGDWKGVTLDNLVAFRTGYGYTGVAEAMSQIENTEIRYGDAGLRIRGQAAPSLSGLTFDTIAGDKHILLDSTDVTIPYAVQLDSCWAADPESCGTFWRETQTTWELDGGTHVVARNGVRAGQDASIGVSGKVDLIVGGKLFAQGASGDTVYFRPETTSSSGDAWGGVTIDQGYAKGGLLEYTDISYAENPLFVFYPDSLWAIRNSRIHDFAETGLWVNGAVGQGGVVESNTIERGAGIGFAYGLMGMRLDQTDELRVRDNRIDLAGLVNAEANTAAIQAYFGKNMCDATPTEYDSLVIEGNYVSGPGLTASGSLSGIYGDWLCGQAQRVVRVRGNYVDGFNHAGLEFVQVSNTQVDCNTVTASAVAVEVSRDSTASGASVRLKGNWLEMLEGGDYTVVRTDNNDKTRLGPSQSNKGDNALTVHADDGNFIEETDPSSNDLHAEDNYWYLWSGTARSLVSDPIDSGEITDRISGDVADVLYDFYQDDDDSTWCAALSAPAVGRLAGGARGDGGGAAQERPDVPAKTFLGAPRGNPSRGVTTLDFGVAGRVPARVSIKVFDIRGRLVAPLVERSLVPGKYEVIWSGRDGAGHRVAAGIYFVRMEGGGFAATRKVMLIR